jgi:N-acetylglutamate synthase-like GNAT family acetyltransferase
MVIRESTAADLGQVRALLIGAGLPTEDLDTAPELRFWAADDQGEIVAAVGLEKAGTAGLLRSLVVAPAYRARGLGRELVATVERNAEADGLELLVLLTQTAETFFSGLGYELVDRAHVPDEIKQHAQFRSLCPASARCLSKVITPRKQVLAVDG